MVFTGNGKICGRLKKKKPTARIKKKTSLADKSPWWRTKVDMGNEV